MSKAHGKSLDELKEIFDNAHDGCPFEGKDERMAAAILAIYRTGITYQLAMSEDYHLHLVRQLFIASAAHRIAVYSLSPETTNSYVSTSHLVHMIQDAWRAIDAFELDAIERMGKR